MLVTFIVFAAATAAFVAAILGFSRLIRPSNPTPEKLESYECGPVPFEQAWKQMNLHYYIFAILFVLFDVEAAFLFPIALCLRKFGAYAFFEVLFFILLLAVGWLYAKRVGALEWER
jgi:NADH-quinone oxidoreductase subunit A